MNTDKGLNLSSVDLSQYRTLTRHRKLAPRDWKQSTRRGWWFGAALILFIECRGLMTGNILWGYLERCLVGFGGSQTQW